MPRCWDFLTIRFYPYQHCFPGLFHCRMDYSRWYLFLFLILWIKSWSFLVFTVIKTSLSFLILQRTSTFVVLSVHGTLSVLDTATSKSFLLLHNSVKNQCLKTIIQNIEHHSIREISAAIVRSWLEKVTHFVDGSSGFPIWYSSWCYIILVAVKLRKSPIPALNNNTKKLLKIIFVAGYHKWNEYIQTHSQKYKHFRE